MVLRLFILASILFFVSCTKVEFNNPDDPDSSNYTGKMSSSSGSGNLCADFTDGTTINHYGKSKAQFCDKRDGKKYVYVKIGDQVWMAENLDYDVPDRKCYETYGRLYDWATAMALPSSCNTSSCASKVSTKHQGICPDGWRIPSNDDWDKLMNFVGDSSTAGKYLKTTSGWDRDGNGNDEFGFSALPGGFGSDDHFANVGLNGLWWSATEYNADAYRWGMGWSYENVDGRHFNKEDAWLSVRCMQDYSGAGVSSSSAQSSSSVVTSSSSFAYKSKGNDINNYKTVEIGDQVWMAENLDYIVPGSRCYDDNVANCADYGRLYDWETAMDLPHDCSYSYCSEEKHRGICPEDWHIPNDDDWDKLISFVGGQSTAGKYLKATSGWNKNGNGEGDKYGFSALPGGLSGFYNDTYSNVGNFGYWWSASESDELNAYIRRMDYNYNHTIWGYSDKMYLLSVRCVQD